MKQQYLQNDLKKNVPPLASVLEPDEFIEYCYWGRFGYFAVTEKRLLVYTKKGMFSDRVLEEYEWGEVAAVGDVVFDRAIKIYLMEVQTLKGNRRLGFNLDGQAAHRFRREIGAAVTRHNTRQREIRALIWSLDLNGNGP